MIGHAASRYAPSSMSVVTGNAYAAESSRTG